MSSKVVPLFDPSRSRRARQKTGGAVRANALPTPIFDPITMSIRELDGTIERLEAAVRAQVRNAHLEGIE